jgi:hypothetical protein
VLLISALPLRAVADSFFNPKTNRQAFATSKGQIREVKSPKLRMI